MQLNDEVELLRKVALFSNIEPAKLKLLAFTSERMNFDAGQSLMRQGDLGNAAYLILSGEADILVDAGGGPVRVASVGRNGFVGEMAVLRDQPRTATVTAVTDVSTLKITKESFFQLIEDSPKIAIELMRILAQRLETTTIDLTGARARLRAAGIDAN
ncbi:MAG: cyclic nucleotide-binding domain-containing protein [Alphaproteobacteria bacterium]|nr:cyclic nucleotide-binding domain-containing protein [Alphaproteobacteria bacterium]